jgi:hypothetical protein
MINKVNTGTEINGSNVSHDTFDGKEDKNIGSEIKLNPELYQLVESIKTRYEGLRKDERRTLEEAIICGEELVKCQKSVKHGQWEIFCETHFEPNLKKMTVSRYVRLFKGKTKIQTCENITEAYHILGIIKDPDHKPKPPKPKNASYRLGSTGSLTNGRNTRPMEAEELKQYPLHSLALRSKNNLVLSSQVLEKEKSNQSRKLEALRNEFKTFFPFLIETLRGGGTVEITESLGEIVTDYCNDWNRGDETELDKTSECNLRTQIGMLSVMDWATDYIQQLVKENLDLSKQLNSLNETTVQE